MGTAHFAALAALVVIFQTLTVVSSEESSCVPGFTSDVYIFKVYRKHLRRGMRLGKVVFTDCTERKAFLFSSDNNRFMVQPDGILRVNLPLVLHDGHRDLNVHAWDSKAHKFTVSVRVVNQGHHNGEGHRQGGQDEQNQGDNQSHHHADHHSQHHGGHHGDYHGEHHRHHHRENDQDHQNPYNEHNHNLHPSNEQVEKVQGATTDPASAVHGQNTEEGLKRNKREVSMKSHVLFFPKATQGLKRRKREWIIPDIKVSENDKGPFPQRVVQIRSSEDKAKVIHYSITGHGADLHPVNLFRMEANTGWLLVTQPLDREKQSNYTFQAHAVADGGTAENPMDIKVIVIDQNDNKPIFAQKTYLGEVAESSPVEFDILQVVATDLDEPGNFNSEIQYRITNQEPKEPVPAMFEINPVTGFIRVNARGLDREKFPKYTLDVSAADMKGDGLQGSTQVILTITDSNDNAPVYTQTNFEAAVPENKVDAFVTKMTVTDRDDPHTPAWNAKFTIVHGDPGGLFTVKTGPNKQEGIITTAKGLDFEMSRKHTLLVAVENEVPFALSLPTATATVVVNVEDVNEAPIFVPEMKQVAKPENLVAGSEVVRYTAHDPDTALNQKVMYKIMRDPAGWLNVAKDTGVITVKTMMDREHYLVKDDIYTALIGAYDDDDVPATGTGTLQIVLQDVNDNAPTIEERSIMVCNKDSAPQLLTVTDKDGEGNGAPYRVTLSGPTMSNWTIRMNNTNTIILNLAKQLDSGMYTVILKVEDIQGMEQDSTIQAEVCDCMGEEVKCGGRNAGGPPLPIILGILGGILLLLMLVLLLLLFARRRGVEKKEPLLQDDDVRDNIYYYDEEGGGEDDQDYDLSVLHRGLDNKPDVFRNDVIPNFMPAPQYRPRPANPEEIGNFIVDNLKAADNDPTAPPYDSLLVFDYEGGGSDAGSLSSLNSSSSGDQDYDCLNEWGPRFKKLADMYGGGDDEDML